MFLFTKKYFEYMENEKERLGDNDSNFWEDFRHSRKTSERSRASQKGDISRKSSKKIGLFNFSEPS